MLVRLEHNKNALILQITKGNRNNINELQQLIDSFVIVIDEK